MASQIGFVQECVGCRLAERHQLLRISDRQSAEQQAVEDREHRCVCADPEGQREDGDRRHDRGGFQRAEGITNFVHVRVRRGTARLGLLSFASVARTERWGKAQPNVLIIFRNCGDGLYSINNLGFLGGMSLKLEGVYSVLPTAFTAAGDLDDASLRRVVDLFIGAGVNGVTALGVTGEVARLEDSERRRVLEVVTSHVAGRIGVVAGTTAEGTRTCINYSRHAKEAGATAVMVSPPRMPKLNSETVLRHFHALAEAVDIEIVVQDYPPISGYAMEPWLLARIAKEIPRARTIKLEDPPTPFKTSRILAEVEKAGEWTT